MIDRKLFTLDKLLDAMLDTSFGNDDKWRELAEIVPDYMPPYPDKDTRPTCVICCDSMFLRYSHGPKQGYFWDCYGDNFGTPEWALLALLQAPVPPHLLKAKVWLMGR